MRFIRIGKAGHEVPAVLDKDGVAREISAITCEIDGPFLERWPTLLGDLDIASLPALSLHGERLGSPIARPSAIYGIGLNYRSHAQETAMEVPSDPLVFLIAPSSLSGPGDDILLPAGSTKGDWEVELGVVIGRRCSMLPDLQSARGVIAGYVAADDVSERAWQMERGGQWSKGKSFPTSHPVGPWLVTADEFEDGAPFELELRVNGETRQSGTTADMVFPVEHIVWHVSQFAQLEPGDLILTGTPDGVGLGRNPPLFLRDGDIIEVEVSCLGAQRNVVRVSSE